MSEAPQKPNEAADAPEANAPDAPQATDAPVEEAPADTPQAAEAPAEQPTEAPAEQPAAAPAEAPKTVAAEQPAEKAPTAKAPEPTPQNGHRVSVEDLLKAGTHFGHLTSRWNPKMRSYIFMERNGIHIIDLMQAQALLDEAAEAAIRFTRQNKKILFVGTKKQAREAIREQAESCGMPYAVERWLGGTLTNYQTIRQSIRRMEGLAKMESDGTLAQLKKKERLMKTREHEKLEKVLGGIADMGRLPGALYVVDINREHIAVDEARKLGIPIIAMVDTNTDPTLVDYPIPANDDALKSIQLVTSVIARAINEGGKARDVDQAEQEAEQQRRAEEKKA